MLWLGRILLVAAAMGATAAQAADTPALLRDPAAFEAFLDRYLSDRAREENRVVGAVAVAVDKDGTRLLRGYGMRDLGSRAPVDPERDLFFVASVSKTFIGMAAMRLVQQGRLRLDDDLRKIIRSVPVPDRFGQPILVRHALTHTTGIVDRLDGTSAPTRETMLPLVEIYRQFPAEQRAPPGRVTSYCNYCISLVAIAIQDITGMDYRDYLLREVLQPLGMRDATMLLPPMSNAALFDGRFVSLYMWNRRAGEFTLYPPMFRSMYPNGSLAAAAPAMARYMRMLLGEGRLDDTVFLDAKLARDMLSPHDWPNPNIPTFGLSFKYGVQNGVRYLGHSGNYRGADTSMVIFPDHNFAYFLSYTGGNGTYHRRILVDLINEAFPRAAAPITPLADAKARTVRVTGRYTDFRFKLNSPMAFAMLFPGQTRIEANEDGSISLTIPKPYFDGGTVRYVEVEPNLFRKVDAGDPKGIGPNLIDHLVFIENARGEVEYFTTSVNNHAISGVKVSWWEYLPVAIAALATTVLLFVVYLVGGAVAALIRAVRRRRAASAAPARVPNARMPAVARAAAVVLAIAATGFVVKYLLTMTGQQDWTILYSFRALGLHYWFALPLLAAAATAVLLVCAVLAWRRHWGTLPLRGLYSVLALAGVVHTLQMAQFRVLDYYF